MNQQDITFYLSSPKPATTGILKKILELGEAIDFSGSQKQVFYNGLEGYSEDVRLEFELSPTDALKLSEEFRHSNFTFLEWQNDELLLEIAELIEEIAEKSNLQAESVSLLIGDHEILSLEDNSIIPGQFSFAFYFEDQPQEHISDLNLSANKDVDLKEKIAILEQICGVKFKCFFGGA